MKKSKKETPLVGDSFLLALPFIFIIILPISIFTINFIAVIVSSWFGYDCCSNFQAPISK